MSVNPNFGEVIEFHSGPANSLYADWVGNIVSVRMKDGRTAWGLCMGVWVQCRELLSDESLVRNKSVIPISYEDRYRYSLTVIISARKTLGAANEVMQRLFARRRLPWSNLETPEAKNQTLKYAIRYGDFVLMKLGGDA